MHPFHVDTSFVFFSPGGQGKISQLQFISLPLWPITSRNLAYISPILFFTRGLVPENPQQEEE